VFLKTSRGAPQNLCAGGAVRSPRFAVGAGLFQTTPIFAGTSPIPRCPTLKNRAGMFAAGGGAIAAICRGRGPLPNNPDFRVRHSDSVVADPANLGFRV